MTKAQKDARTEEMSEKEIAERRRDHPDFEEGEG